jgi:FtsZ-interacting cell division protein ZipA
MNRVTDGTGVNLPGIALIVIAVVLVIALFHGWG